MTLDSITQVAQDLTEIAKLYGWVEEQAIHRADDKLMPGGRATVALAHVGSPREWAEQVAADELYHLSTCPKADHGECHYAMQAADEDNDETPLQTLLFWSEAWREEHGYAIDATKATMESELGFIRQSLNWAWANEVHWDDFRQDVAEIKTKLENLLMAGIRSERGVPCMYDECKGVRLVRKMEAHGKDGVKVWRLTDWFCPRCHRKWDEDAYQRNIAAAVWRAQSEDIGGEVWCSAHYAARKVDRPETTIRAWASKREVATACIIRGRRTGFVLLADVEELANKTRRRTRAGAA